MIASRAPISHPCAPGRPDPRDAALQASPRTWRSCGAFAREARARALRRGGAARLATIKPLAGTRVLLKESARCTASCSAQVFRASFEQRVETLVHSFLIREFDGRLRGAPALVLPGRSSAPCCGPGPPLPRARRPRSALRAGTSRRGGGAPVARAPDREVEPRAGVQREAPVPGPPPDDHPPSLALLKLEIGPRSCEVPPP